MQLNYLDQNVFKNSNSYSLNYFKEQCTMKTELIKLVCALDLASFSYCYKSITAIREAFRIKGELER